MSIQSIAVNRFGIGGRPGDAPPGHPGQWLAAQFGRYQPRPAPIAAAADSASVATALAEYQREEEKLRQGSGEVLVAAPPPADPAHPAKADAAGGGTPQPLPDEQGRVRVSREVAERMARSAADGQARRTYADAVAARAAAALASDTPFIERLVWFWSNHFAVSIDKLPVVGLAGTLEFEAIRPNVFSHFGVMLSAVERHPAMLIYLDQAISVGPHSQLGEARARHGDRRVGFNENLAREILELHTLGVRSGYTQADVTEFARAMTGWTVGRIGGGPLARTLEGFGKPGQCVFAEPIHEPGTRTIMGKRYPDRGYHQAQGVLDDLAVAPATARHIATKLARHFAGDDPPAAMVVRLEQAFLSSGGYLPDVYVALINSPEAWVDAPIKFRTPWEWSIAAYRALGTDQVQPAAIVGLLNQLGQPVWKPGEPAGYDDIAGSWASSGAVMRRVEAAERLAAHASSGIDARTLAATLFPGALSAATAQTLARAESPAQALALLLIAPEMQRR